jgi:8-oxo-dGTP pyrophosphatase MutT (NUDIX family)
VEKFSKLKPKNEFDEGKEETLYSDDYVKVIKYKNWSIIDEDNTAFCIPVLIETNEIVLRYEYIPTFEFVDGQQYHVTLVGGKIEVGESPSVAILRELEEEAGIVVREDYKVEELKPLYKSKGSTSKFHLFILPLNERDYHEVLAKGDGSEIEAMSKSVKISVKNIDSINTSDLITDYMLLKVKEYLNL